MLNQQNFNQVSKGQSQPSGTQNQQYWYPPPPYVYNMQMAGQQNPPTGMNHTGNYSPMAPSQKKPMNYPYMKPPNSNS